MLTMNIKNFNLNVFLFIVLISLFFIVLVSLFLQVFFLEYFFYYSINEHNYVNTITDYFRVNQDYFNNSDIRIDSGSRLDPERTSSSCSCSCTSSSSSFTSSSSEDAHCFGFFNKYKVASNKVFNKLKENIQIKSKIVSRNLTRLDRTVS